MSTANPRGSIRSAGFRTFSPLAPDPECTRAPVLGLHAGMGAGKSGVKRNKELFFESQHIALRTYKFAPGTDLKPGEYAFFMGTNQSSMVSSGRGTNFSGGAAAGRIYDFTFVE